jgi:acetate kinase
MSPGAFGNLLNQQAGLLGVSGISADMQDQLGRERIGPCAADAVESFATRRGSLLGRSPACSADWTPWCFTAAIGEHAAPVRARICGRLAYVGLELDPDRNAAHAPIISRTAGSAVVRVVKTDEELMIARHTDCVISTRGGNHVPV